MPWTTPFTWLASQIVTADKLNEQLRSNLDTLSTHVHSGAAGQGDDELAGIDKITFDDVASSPTAAGELKRNGVNLEWYGAAKVAITEADAAAATASPRTLGTGALQAAVGSHGHAFANYAMAEASAEVASNAGQGYYTHGGRYAVALSTTITYASYTSTKKLAAFHIGPLYCVNSSNGNVKISIEVDGVEQTSYTIATGETKGNISLLALAVKQTADIAFVSKFQNAGNDISVNVDVMSHTVVTGNGLTTDPTAQRAIADLT